MTEENKEKIRKIIKDHYDSFDILRIADYDIRQKAAKIQEELHPIYKKLKQENLLPEEIDAKKFVEFGNIMLQQSFQEAIFKNAFGNFI